MKNKSFCNCCQKTEEFKTVKGKIVTKYCLKCCEKFTLSERRSRERAFILESFTKLYDADEISQMQELEE